MASVATGVARAQSVELTPEKDNTLIQWSAETGGSNPLLSNGLGDIYVGRTNQDGQGEATISIRRGLIRFDLAGAVPSGMKLTAATLSMRDVRGLNGDPLVSLHRVEQDWGEGGSFFEGGQGAPAADGDATWLHAFYHPVGGSIAWNTPGGDYTPVASAEAQIIDDLGGGKLFAWSGPGMVVDLREWLLNPNTNFGWIVLGDETRGQSAKRFDSHESTESPSEPPRLRIEYEPVLAGDYNDDGFVDATDYTVWRNSLSGIGRLENETVTIGSATEEDYFEWRSHFGAVGNGALESAALDAEVVSEPSSTQVLVVGMIVTSLLFQRKFCCLGVY